MKFLSHAVIHRGIIYYNTIINTDQNRIALSGYYGEEESTIFINGIIIVVSSINITDTLFTSLQEILDNNCYDIEEAIDKINLWLGEHNLFVNNDSNSFSLISISPELKLLSTN